MAAIASVMPVRMAVAPKARATNAARALKATTVTGKALRFAPLRCATKGREMGPCGIWHYLALRAEKDRRPVLASEGAGAARLLRAFPVLEWRPLPLQSGPKVLAGRSDGWCAACCGAARPVGLRRIVAR